MTGADFHTLRVSAVDRLTEDSVAIEFDVPENLADAFSFIAGQHVIVRHDIDGHDVRRSYSLCIPEGTGRVRVAVKQIDDGRFSTFANTTLRPGMSLDVTTPIGDFTAHAVATNRNQYCAIAAGSGITPVISILSTLLRDEPESSAYLIYGNRHGRSVMFLDELAELKDRYLARLTLVHVLSRESSDVSLFEGRLEVDKINKVLDAVVPVEDIDRWFVCGPLGVVENAQTALAGRGVDPSTIGTELFFDERPPEVPDVADDSTGAIVRFTLGGRTSEVRVDPDGPPILDYVLSVRPDAPFSCRNGACASCRALVTTGKVAMHHNWCLTESEVAAGQVLSCQSHPVSDNVEMTYDV